jgi:hypothetical protein
MKFKQTLLLAALTLAANGAAIRRQTRGRCQTEGAIDKIIALEFSCPAKTRICPA